MERAGVQVVFDGHVHGYERSRPHNGVTYVAVGTGGAEMDNDADDPTIPTARVIPGRYGALRVDVSGGVCAFSASSPSTGRCATSSASAAPDDGRGRSSGRRRCSRRARDTRPTLLRLAYWRTVGASQGGDVSLASLGSNYALRTVATPTPAAAVGAARPPGGKAPPPDPPAAQSSGVPQKTIDALVRWIPAETITLYVTIISISNTSLSKNQAFAILLVCLVINVGTVWSIAVHRAVQTLDPGATGSVSSRLTSPCGRSRSAAPPFRVDLGDPRLPAPAALVLGSVGRRRRHHRHAVVIAFLAAQLNLSPPADQTPQS